MSEQIISKRCSKCKRNKPLSDYSKRRASIDGLQSCCKSCIKAYQQSEKGKAANYKAVKKYNQTPNGKACKKAYQQSENYKAVEKCYRQSDKGKAVRRKKAAKLKANNPNYVKANYTVNNAIKAGKLPRPDTRLCHYCQKLAQQYHHWHGYEKEHWLDVVPACKKCHKEVHRKVA